MYLIYVNAKNLNLFSMILSTYISERQVILFYVYPGPITTESQPIYIELRNKIPKRHHTLKSHKLLFKNKESNKKYIILKQHSVDK